MATGELNLSVTRSKMLSSNRGRKQNFGLMPISIAHDLNNLLTVLLFNAEMLNQQTELSVFSRQRVDEILVSAQKASQLNQQILLTQVDRENCLLYTSPSPRDATLSRMPSSA